MRMHAVTLREEAERRQQQSAISVDLFARRVACYRSRGFSLKNGGNFAFIGMRATRVAGGVSTGLGVVGKGAGRGPTASGQAAVNNGRSLGTGAIAALADIVVVHCLHIAQQDQPFVQSSQARVERLVQKVRILPRKQKKDTYYIS